MSVSTLHPLPKVAVGRHLSSESVNLDNYRSWVGDALTEEIRQLCKDLHGLRVCNLNATATGGGVAELLSRMIPVYLALGIEADWRLIYGDKEFFTITKSFHNALQGGKLHLTDATEQVYLERNRQSAEMLSDDYDVFIVHDPQPAAIRHFMNSGNKHKWIWRCHIDSSAPNSEVWEFLRTYIQEYDAAVFTMKAFQPGDLNLDRIVFIPPAIDPAATKNMELPTDVCHRAIGEMGVDLHRPLLLQVARFDPWKDPLGVIEAYRQVKKARPEVQLAMLGAMAGDDPEAWGILTRSMPKPRTIPTFTCSQILRASATWKSMRSSVQLTWCCKSLSVKDSDSSLPKHSGKRGLWSPAMLAEYLCSSLPDMKTTWSKASTIARQRPSTCSSIAILPRVSDVPAKPRLAPSSCCPG